MHRKAAASFASFDAKLEPEGVEAAVGRSKAEQAEYHYRFALKLRKDFALAALNLGALQYAQLNQLAEALESFKRCGFQMDPSKVKSFHQHVSTQIECLISGARLLLELHSGSTNRPFKGTGCGLRSKKGKLFGGATAMTKQTMPETDVAETNCETLLEWSEEARAKANQVLASSSWFPSREVPNVLLEPNKQLATIHWLRAQCICDRHSSVLDHYKESFSERNELGLAVEYAKRSQVPIEANIYISYVDLLLKHEQANTSPDLLVQVLQEAIRVERQKLDTASVFGVSMKDNFETFGHREEIAKLYLRLAQMMASSELVGNSKQAGLDDTLRLVAQFGASNFNLLSKAAQVGYKSGLLERAEKLYLLALKVAQREWQVKSSGEAGRKLASAFANLGAIKEVGGKLDEALRHYRQALDYDPKNIVAATNSARLGSKVSRSM